MNQPEPRFPETTESSPSSPPRGIATSWKSSWFIVTISLMVMGGLLHFGTPFLGDGFPYKIELKFLGVILFVAGGFTKVPFLSSQRFRVEDVSLSELGTALQSRVDALTAKMGLEPAPARVVTETIQGRFAAVHDRRGIGIGIHALEQFQPAEVDFLIARTLAHKKLGYDQELQRFGIGTILFLMLPACGLVWFSILELHRPLYAFGLLLIFLVLMLPLRLYRNRMTLRQEIEADRLAIETTRDPASAASALQKTALEDGANRPQVSARLAKMPPTLG